MSGTSDLLFSHYMDLPLKRHSSVPRRFKPALISPELINKMRSLSDHTRNPSPSLLNSDKAIPSIDNRPVRSISSRVLNRKSDSLLESTTEPKSLIKPAVFLDLPFRKEKEEASLPSFESILDSSPLRRTSKSIYSHKTASPDIKADILNQLSYIKHMKISMDLNREMIPESSIFDILTRVVELLKPFEKILNVTGGCPLCGCKNENKQEMSCEKAKGVYEVDLRGVAKSYRCERCRGDILSKDNNRLICEYCNEKERCEDLDGNKLLIMKIQGEYNCPFLKPKPPSSENTRVSNPIRQQRIGAGASTERTHRIRPVSASRCKSISDIQNLKVTIGGTEQSLSISKDSIFRIILPSFKSAEFTLNCDEFKHPLKSVSENLRKRSLDLPLQISSFNRKVDGLDKVTFDCISNPDTPNFAAGGPIAICIK